LIEVVTGSLFDHIQDKYCVVAHVVNDQRGWGKGFSGEVSKRWPIVEQSYRAWKDDFRLGQVQFVNVAGNDLRGLPLMFVANMLAQHGYKHRFNPHPCNLEALELCLMRLRGFTGSGMVYRVIMPKIGTGLGGRRWDEILPIIERNLENVTIVDYDGKVT
jgi:O-acetyl-ADP-ribose deacetylase (regulator of RNase III)